MIRSHDQPVASAVAAGSNCGRRSTALKKSPTADLGLSKSFRRPRYVGRHKYSRARRAQGQVERAQSQFFQAGRQLRREYFSQCRVGLISSGRGGKGAGKKIVADQRIAAEPIFGCGCTGSHAALQKSHCRSSRLLGETATTPERQRSGCSTVR